LKNEESSLSPDQQLELIAQMLKESRKAIISMGFSSMIWGGFVSVGTALSYAFASWGWYVGIGILWAILMISAFLLVRSHSRRAQHQQHKTTLLNKVFNEMWIFVFAAIVLYEIAGFLRPQSISLSYVLSVVSILVGTAYWISGSMTHYLIVRIVSIVWIIGSIIVLLVPPFWSPAVVGSCTLLCEFIPGIYLLCKRTKTIHLAIKTSTRYSRREYALRRSRCSLAAMKLNSLIFGMLSRPPTVILQATSESSKKLDTSSIKNDLSIANLPRTIESPRKGGPPFSLIAVV